MTNREVIATYIRSNEEHNLTLHHEYKGKLFTKKWVILTDDNNVVNIFDTKYFIVEYVE